MWTCQCQNVNQDSNLICPKCQRSKTSGYSKSYVYDRDQSNNGSGIEDIVYITTNDSTYSSDSSSSSSCDSSSSSSD